MCTTIDEKISLQLTPAQIELLQFLSPENSDEIPKHLERVFNLAVFQTGEPLDHDDRKALYYVHRICKLIEETY